MGAEEVGSLPSRKIPRPLSVDPCFPVSVNIPVAFAAEPVAFFEADEFSIVKPQFVAVFCIVAVQAPTHCLSMMEPDIGMFVLEFPLVSVHLHRSMAVAAGENSLCHRRRGNRKLFLNSSSHGSEISPEENEKDNDIGQFPSIWAETVGCWRFYQDQTSFVINFRPQNYNFFKNKVQLVASGGGPEKSNDMPENEYWKGVRSFRPQGMNEIRPFRPGERMIFPSLSTMRQSIPSILWHREYPFSGPRTKMAVAMASAIIPFL